MKHNMYAIYDTAAGMYLRPFTAIADGQAQRGFSDIIMDKDHEFGKHPEDYTLFKVGIFDDNNGEITPFVPEKIITGLAVVAASREIKPGSLKEISNA